MYLFWFSIPYSPYRCNPLPSFFPIKPSGGAPERARRGPHAGDTACGGRLHPSAQDADGARPIGRPSPSNCRRGERREKAAGVQPRKHPEKAAGRPYALLPVPLPASASPTGGNGNRTHPGTSRSGAPSKKTVGNRRRGMGLSHGRHDRPLRKLGLVQGTMCVPLPSRTAARTFSGEVMMASLPVALTKSTAASTLGSMLPGAKCPASTQAIASATVIRERSSCSGVPKRRATLGTAVEMTNRSLPMRLASRQEVRSLSTTASTPS